MIKKLEWDSEFFHFPVGKLEISERQEEIVKAALAEKNHYSLIYIFADHEISALLPGITTSDVKITFHKIVKQPQEFANAIVEYDSNKHSYQELLDLVFLSGTFSRFKKDVRFTEKEFFKLYQEWIDKSIQSETSKVLVYEEGGALGGFITLEEMAKKSCRIGLIAVHPDYQGKNIATQLIRTCQSIAYEQGKKIIEVSTQDENIAAKSLYVKNGFEIIDAKYIYHLWKQ